MTLSGKQRRALRALGHHLKPVVLVGQHGVTPAVVSAVNQALHDHELVKVKLSDEDREARAEAVARLAADTTSEVAQVLGKTALLYRPRKDDPKIKV